MRSNPAADARLQRAPKEVRVVFSEPPDARGSELAVFDANGARVDSSDTGASDEANGLRVSLKDVGEGGYLVAWAALSSVDGHLTRGSFAFAVGNAPLPALADVGEASTTPRPLEIAGRALSFGGLVLLLGGPLFVLAVRRRPTAAEERREQILLAAGAAMLVVGAVALLVEQGGRAPPRLAALLTARGLAGVVVLGAAAAFSERRVRVVALAAGLLAALSATLVSHAAATGDAAQLALDLVHVLAAGSWAGGVVAMLAVMLPSARTFPRGELGRVVARFSASALVSVGILAVTGVVQALLRLVLVQDLWETPYGIAVLAKIVLLAIALVFAAVNLLRWAPLLDPRSGGPLASGPGARPRRFAPRSARPGDDVDVQHRARRWLGRNVAGETAAIVLILVATGLLTALVPPAQASGAAYTATRHAGGLRLELLLASATPGQNRYVLRVSEGVRPVADALRVAFRFTMIEHDMGENELVAQQRAPGEYVATGNVTAMFGTWRIQAIVRLPDRADITTTFEVPIGAPSGPGAVARVVQAGPYTLVVYVDPAQPLEGAPVTVNIVLVDAKGDPVGGKPVRVAFSGPGAEAADAREISPGRYDAAVPALAAGRWTARIRIGTEATGDYVFDVAR